ALLPDADGAPSAWPARRSQQRRAHCVQHTLFDRSRLKPGHVEEIREAATAHRLLRRRPLLDDGSNDLDEFGARLAAGAPGVAFVAVSAKQPRDVDRLARRVA